MKRYVIPDWVPILLAFVVLNGCAAGPPSAPATSGSEPGKESLALDLGRVQTLEQDGVTVEVAIPTEAHAAQLFGVELAKFGIQPIWLRIENASDVDYWLLPIAIDRDYYSADEAALVTGAKRDSSAGAGLLQPFRQSAMPLFLRAGTTNEGYVYATYTRGGRFVDVRLSGHKRAVRLRFAVLLPTQGFDYELSPLQQLYQKVDSFPDLTLPQFRQRLRELPCCTSREDGTGEGDPINVVIVGSGEDAVASLVESGWTFTEAITVDSIRRMVGAAIARQSYYSAPVSSLYAFGRKQDLALQRGRATISQRNHMRLWLAPFRCEGSAVWIGQVSRDIGVKMTSKSPSLTTHIIDPVVDESREYLFHSLLQSEAVGRFAFVKGVGAATIDDPRRNLTGDPYFTDGMRLVVWLSREPVPSHDTEDLGWNDSADPVREGKGEEALIEPLMDRPADPPR
jgi:LssY C-terminus